MRERVRVRVRKRERKEKESESESEKEREKRERERERIPQPVSYLRHYRNLKTGRVLSSKLSLILLDSRKLTYFGISKKVYYSTN